MNKETCEDYKKKLGSLKEGIRNVCDLYKKVTNCESDEEYFVRIEDVQKKLFLVREQANECIKIL